MRKHCGNAVVEEGRRGMMRGEQARSGQSTVEYLLVVVAVLLAVIYGVKTLLQPKIEGHMDNAGALVDKASTEFQTVTGAVPKAETSEE